MAIPTYVPLVISIFALILPSLNTLKVFFETAEGYKKCSEAVIGPWPKLRWRRWSWSEFRFETHFVTPKIVLHDISEGRVKQASYLTRYLTLRDRRPRDREGEAGNEEEKHGPGYRAYLPWHWRLFSTVKCADALLQSGTILDAGLTPDFDIRSTQVAIPGLTVAVSIDEEKQSDKLLRNGTIHITSEQRVSWLTFLRHLFKVENGSPSALDPTSASTMALEHGKDRAWVELLECPEYQHLDLKKSRNETGVSISLTEWTWDSLPAKATRPMASSNLGTLVIMAVRLGMEWRIDLDKDTFQAAGNGYSLSCTYVPEMGLVASFTAEETEQQEYHSPLAFNNSTDMLTTGCDTIRRLAEDKRW